MSYEEWLKGFRCGLLLAAVTWVATVAGIVILFLCYSRIPESAL